MAISSHAFHPCGFLRLFCLSLSLFSLPVSAQQLSSDLLSGLSWRLIGPFRGGRVTAVAGVPGDLKTYYMGTPGGGIWKTTNGGETWFPIFDKTQVAFIGDLVVAPSNPNIIYVATGDIALGQDAPGNGVWKSTDAGATWNNIGIRDSRIIPSLLVDPQDPNIVYVAALGDLTSGNSRGIYKSTDGGASWRKVFFKDDHTSPTEICFDPSNSHILYAVMRTVPAAAGEKPVEAVDTVIIKSTDAGETWSALGDQGLPGNHRGRIGIAVAPAPFSNRVFALMSQGLFRSDDGGSTWHQITTDPRILGNNYFGRVYSDTHDPDVVYVMQTSTYRSVDGGRTFTAWKGTPSGEDDHVLWISPEDSSRIIMGTDQGAVITLDRGKTWNTWYNQPTGQFYRVSTDQAFPYRLYASQQDSGSVAVPSRSDFGIITYRDWFPTGSFESAFIAPDPLNPNFVYSIGWYGVILRLDRATGHVATLFVPPSNYRAVWETPLLFSPRDPHTLYYASQFLLKSTDNGLTWKEISPDLTTKTANSPGAAKPPGGGHIPSRDEIEFDDPDADPFAQQPGHGSIQAIAPSPLDPNLIWVGTTTGLIHVTHDASTWSDVSPAGLPEHSYINSIEASPHDPNTAFAAIFVRSGDHLHFFRPDDHPYFYRTRDAGKSWEKIVTGLPDAGIARVVREDPGRKGLLFAGTENGVYFSFDFGDQWQPLQRNLPTSSVRDLAVHGRDLVAATFGRGLWILDELTPLRQMSATVANSAVHFFQPEPALRVRWDNYPDTPLSPETPAGHNPPDGALLDYYFKTAPKGEVTLDIFDAKGNHVQHSSSVAPPPDAPPGNVPEYWFAPPEVLPAKAGVNRFVWNLRYPHPTALTYGYFGKHLDYIEYTLPDHAIPGETPRYQPQGPLVVPGQYELALTVEGKTYRQKLAVELDPRVQVSQADLAAQMELARKLADWMDGSARTYEEVSALSKAIAERKKALASASASKESTDAANEMEKQIAALESGSEDAPGFGPLNRDIGRYLTMIESADIRPAESARKAAEEACQAYKKDVVLWNKLNAEGVPALNKLLQPARLAALTQAKPSAEPSCAE